MIIYQLLPRLFGNDNTRCIPDGTIHENGCGKLNDITYKALEEIKKLGVSHIWYTGLLEHATQTDYSTTGIRKDHSAMVKGKAGSPYAVKDYFDIDPDLASKPEKRFTEFRNLVKRTHKAGMKVVMDFIPNHVARQYHSDNTPPGIESLGETDHMEFSFSPQNNFYYINAALQCQFDMKASEPSAYAEYPAKATGNDCFSPCPSINDWYETIKLNYGVDYADNHSQHFNPIPNTWYKMCDILRFWANEGIDAFRCDMAEMVPCEFWEWAIPQIKEMFPHTVFIAEVYNPSLYRSYIHQGHFDFLYDKVGLYDTLRNVTQGFQPAHTITSCWQAIEDIRPHMLNFLENHDEQRIASDFYAGNGQKGKAALIVSSCMSTQPFMLYSGQELGERGMDQEGFSGMDGRTTIFDYWSVKTLREWRNKGRFDGKELNDSSKQLLDFYRRVLSLKSTEKALSEGAFFDLMYVNPSSCSFNADKTYAFLRSYKNEHILIVANFSNEEIKQSINIPLHAIELQNIKEKCYKAKELISEAFVNIRISASQPCEVTIPAHSGIMLKFTD